MTDTDRDGLRGGAGDDELNGEVGGGEGACAARQAVILELSRHRLHEAAESNRPQNTRSAYARERARWEGYLQDNGLSGLLDHVTASTPGVIADYLAKRLRIYPSSSRNTLSNSVLKQAKAVLSHMFEEKGWTGPWRSSGPSSRPEGNPMRSEAVQQIVKLRRDAAAREGTVPVNADPLEYEMLAMSFQTLKKEVYPCLTSRSKNSNGPLEFTHTFYSSLSPTALRYVRAYSFAVLAMGTLSRFKELACRRFGDLQIINGNLVYLDFDSGTKTDKTRIHRILRPWDGLDDHRIDPSFVYRLWMTVRGCEKSESEYIFPHIKNESDLCLSLPMEEAEWTKDMRSLLLHSSVRKSFVSRISTHSCRRGGVQLMLDLGYSENMIMEIGGWESVAAFWCYTRPCNRRKSRFASRGLLRSQLIHMQRTNCYLREELDRVRRSCMCQIRERVRRNMYFWPEEVSSISYFSEMGRSGGDGDGEEEHHRSLRDPFIDAIYSPVCFDRRDGRSENTQVPTQATNSVLASMVFSLERKIDKILEHNIVAKRFVNGFSTENGNIHGRAAAGESGATRGSAVAASNTNSRKHLPRVIKRIICPASNFSEVLRDWEQGRAGSEPLREIWKKRKNLCYRDKELLRKRLDVVLYYYDVRKHRGDLAWEREIMIKDYNGKKEKKKLGELLHSARKHFSLDINKRRKREMLNQML